MKRFFKTITAFIIAIVFCVNSAMIVSAEGETSGNCGDGVTWSYDADTSTLTIEGSGRMSDYSSSENPPWYQYRADIRSIKINEGVTYIGSSAFMLSGSRTFYLPRSLTFMGFLAIEPTTGDMIDVIYAGTEEEWNNIFIEDPDTLYATINTLSFAG